MCSRNAEVIRRWLPRVLSTLQQGSTISVRSTVAQPNIFIKSSWRDDGVVSMIHRLKEQDSRIGLYVSMLSDKSTSMGRDESHVLVELTEDGGEIAMAGHVSATLSMKRIDEGIHSRICLESEIINNVEDSSEYVMGCSEEITLVMELPEKINIDCDLSGGGSVTINNKIEGDVRIKTTNGNISIQKLRGHSIEIAAAGPGNTIYSSDLLEAKTLSISLPCSGRLRAKRIHASSCSVTVESVDKNLVSQVGNERFDADDSGAICDISSLYITGDANIHVRCSEGEGERQAVRVKSSHGHVMVQASAPLPGSLNHITNEALPVVDMGGVNGSCEVFVDTNGSGMASNDVTSCRVHFDSIAAESVSIVKSNVGIIHVTIDRKVESDIRMLSCTEPQSIDFDTFLLDQEDEGFESLATMLEAVDGVPQSSVNDKIQVKTQAFTTKEEEWYPTLKNAKFLNGWVENKSAEPDSRFDRKLRGETGSMGKIRLDGASNQALSHFQSDSNRKITSGSNFVRPIVAVVGSGTIVLETLSWLGNIARRYGLDERRDAQDLGRTATRRGRSLKSEIDE